MNKRALIIKDSKAKVKYKDSHIEVISLYQNQYIGIEQIGAIYIHQDIDLQIKESILIPKKVPIYFTTASGAIVAKISLQV